MKLWRKYTSFITLKRTLLALLCAVLVTVVFIVGSLIVLWLQTNNDPLPDKLAREKANTAKSIVADVTELYPIKVQGIIVPHTTEEIIAAVKANDHVSIGGGRNSMGGQTASSRAVQIDMREFNHVLSLSTTTKEITVQAGIRWYEIQKYIDPYGLSVSIMQTYSNFTVGGSLSVNVHGRYVGEGPIVMSVKSFRIVLADGTQVEASPEAHSDIFYSAIGGLGGIGVITDVTLQLSDNVNVERTRVKLPTSSYKDFFFKNVRSNGDVIFHNGDIYPPAFEEVSAVSWSKTDKAPTTDVRFIPRTTDYTKDRMAWAVMSEWPFGKFIREHLIDPYLYRDTPVHTRNFEASYDIAELEPSGRADSTYVLEEYFVPVENFDAWVPKMKAVFDEHKVNVLNVSIRHAKADPGTYLAWAPTESFAFVVYYKQGTSEEAKKEVSVWTREMIDQVLSVHGTYYLPYQPWATDTQFARAYPGSVQYFQIKKHYDPTDKFTNNLWDTYYSVEKAATALLRQKELSIASTTPDYFRKYDNTIITLPEWYIVYAADEYAAVLRDSMPSRFPYFKANSEYWKQYHTVLSLTASSTENNADYRQVLSVIGWSFSVENVVKGVYENTIGRVTEWFSGDLPVPEDRYAAHVAEEYANFIYDKPWYDYPYAKALVGVWTIRGSEKYNLMQDVRRVERKLFLTGEYGLKTIYSKVIAYLTHSKFGVQDDITSAVVTYDAGITFELLQAPHYQPFTRALVALLSAQIANDKFSVVDIAGNKNVTLTYKDVPDAKAVAGGTELLRDREVIAIEGGKMVERDRISVSVKVEDLTRIFKQLSAGGIVIDHIYDF